MDIKDYCRRKLTSVESAAVSGFTQLSSRGMAAQSAVVLAQNGEKLTLATIAVEENRLTVTSTQILEGVGSLAAVSVAAKKLMEDFKKTEGIDLSTSAQAVERIENAVAEAFEKLADNYTAEIFLPFIADVSHLEAHLSRNDMDALMANAFSKLREYMAEICPDLTGKAVIIQASDGDAKRLMRFLKDAPGVSMDRVLADDGSGQEKENAWIAAVIDTAAPAQYPAFSDNILPSVEALVVGRFAPVAVEIRNLESDEDAFKHGMDMIADKLEEVLRRYHALSAGRMSGEASNVYGTGGDTENAGNEQFPDLKQLPIGFMKTVMKDILAAKDDLERGLATKDEQATKNTQAADLLALFDSRLASLGITLIEAAGQAFDPQLHDAAMHVEDPAFSENVVAEELRKGYRYGAHILRYSVVKVAN